MKLDIILPVYNERDSIKKVISEWQEALDSLKIPHHIIVCEDGSTDGTDKLLRKIRSKYNLILNQKRYRRGYGKAVIDGIKTSRAEYILHVDSDGQCDPEDFKKFWEERNRADVVIGWRVRRADPFQRKLYSFLFKTVFKALFPVKVHDPSCPFVLYKREKILPHLKYLSYLKEGFWWGFVGMCYKKKLSVYEIPIHHRQRYSGTTVVYKISKLPKIVISNLIGLFKLKLAK